MQLLSSLNPSLVSHCICIQPNLPLHSFLIQSRSTRYQSCHSQDGLAKSNLQQLSSHKPSLVSLCICIQTNLLLRMIGRRLICKCCPIPNLVWFRDMSPFVGTALPPFNTSPKYPLGRVLQCNFKQFHHSKISYPKCYPCLSR